MKESDQTPSSHTFTTCLKQNYYTPRLRELVWKRQVLLWWKALDRYGRPIAQVSFDGMDVSAEQVKRGFAWVFRRYSNDPALLALEAQANSAGIGLWADPHPIAPWDWRVDRHE